MSGIFNIKEKREITLAEYYGDELETLVLKAFDNALDFKGNSALVTKSELLKLLKTAKLHPFSHIITFPKNIYSAGDGDRDYLYSVHTNNEWWR